MAHRDFAALHEEAFEISYQCGRIGGWLNDTVQKCEAGECALSLDSLISVGSKHLFALEEIIYSDRPAAPALHAALTKLTKWINRWRDAADEAETLGLDSDISYKYWHHNIELPEEVIRAQKWFKTAGPLANSNAMNPTRLVQLISGGGRTIAAAAKCQSSWPQARRLSMERRIDKYGLLLAKWARKVRLLAFNDAQEKGADVATMELRAREALKAADRLKEAEKVFLNSKKNRRAIRAKMRKKRTCSHCGKTGPLSQVSFAYCGGCRHSAVAREHWTRYCSEACQRAHWAAGHKHECPCAQNG
jgi:hypothetical protein